ncbi:hypothetical protein CRE_22440 [Caenorhabditis remanei]|uniref:Uncharacterized protein n=1 Tax=Caenorhabditis remanei TaxID=31234 RepID=E3ME59_CAERE|nr:hypothetical protein CRE_22440 [Caenorhabditis remanei]
MNAHFEVCEGWGTFSEERKLCHTNEIHYRKKITDLDNLLESMKFSNVKIEEGEPILPQVIVPCFCVVNADHKPSSCLYKLREPEMRTRGRPLLEDIFKHLRDSEEKFVEEECRLASECQANISQQFLLNVSEETIAQTVGQGYRQYRRQNKGYGMYRLVVEMYRKVSAVDGMKKKIEKKTKEINENFEKKVAEVVKANQETLQEWENQSKQDKNKRRAAPGSSGNQAMKVPRHN